MTKLLKLCFFGVVLLFMSGCALDSLVAPKKQEIVKRDSYTIDKYIVYMMYSNQSSIDVFTKQWENRQKEPEIVFKNADNYVARWYLGVNYCTVYINFDPKTKIAKKAEWSLVNCEKVTMNTGPVIEVITNMPYSAGVPTRDEQLADIMESWIGKDIDDAFIKWGSPWGSVALNSGGKVHTWKNSWASGDYIGVCEQTLISDKKGKIVNWKTGGCLSKSYGKIPSFVPIPQPRN